MSTSEARGAPSFLSQAIIRNRLIFVSGQVHNLPDNTLTGGTFEAKVSQIMKNLSIILKSAGATLDDIIKVTIYVTDMSQMPELNRVYPKYFAGSYPAREAICVSALPLSASIEMSVIAEQ